MTRLDRRIALLVAVTVAPMFLSCRATHTALLIGVTFENTWRVGDALVREPERILVKTAVLRTLSDAYAGFALRFVESPQSERRIRIIDTPPSRFYVGAAGATFAASSSSNVHFDSLAFALLAAAHCHDIDRCSGKSRGEMIEALAHGVGATAAHELGHQLGLFALHPRCDECYDSESATTVMHFFGPKRWSESARARMRRLLPVE